MFLINRLQYSINKQQSQITTHPMSDDMQGMLALFANPDPSIQNNKKLRSRKQMFLLKYQLFTLIYQKKGQQNFSQIVNKIRMVQYGFAYDIYNEHKDRYFTYIIKGLIMIFVNKADDPTSIPTLYRKMGANEHFGEKLLYGNNQKLHSAKSVSKTYVFQLDLETFYKTFAGHFKYQELKEKVEFLKNIWIFNQINKHHIERILLLSKPYRYIKNTILFKQGDQPEAVYVVIQGELTLFKKSVEPETQYKYMPFMILSKGEVCACQEVLERSAMRCGGTVTSSEAILLRIGVGLFMDIFEDKIQRDVINDRNQVKERLIEVKSKKSISMSLQKLKQTEKLLQQQQKKPKERQKRTVRYLTQAKQLKIQQIFDITQGSVTWQNRLKNHKLRQFTLNQRMQRQKMTASTIRLSTMTNHSFTNDKQLLLSYLIRKERTERKADQWERRFEKEKLYQAKELVVGTSPAVKMQKRKLRQSRRKNAVSMPTLM